MTVVKIKSWVSFALLFLAYVSLGWVVTGSDLPKIEHMLGFCIPQLERSLSETQVASTHAPEPGTQPSVPGKSSQSEHPAPEATSAPERSASPDRAVESPLPHAATSPEFLSRNTSKSSPVAETNRPKPTQPESTQPALPTMADSFSSNRQLPAVAAVCDVMIQYKLPGILLAIVWICLASAAFMTPLTNFSRFVNRWFQSDAVAFLVICMIAGMAALMLFFLHVFLQILTILAAEALARIDIQVMGLNEFHAFWILMSVSLAGLLLGWASRFLLPYWLT